MENSTSLRFLEASGRPSGTGRPSLQPPRADHDRGASARKDAHAADERSDAARSEHASRRKAHASPAHDAQAQPSEQPTPFDELLDDAQSETNTPEAAPTDATDAPAKPTAPTGGEAQDTQDGAKQKSKLGEPEANVFEVLARPTNEKPLPEALLGLGTKPVEAASARSTPPTSANATPAVTADPAFAVDANANLDPAAKPAAASGAEAPFAIDPELVKSSSARDASLAAEPASAAPARTENALPVAAKIEAAPAPTHAETERAGEILRQMRVQISPELRTATIQLSPPELGRISIRLRVERGELRAVVRAERAETLAALERHVPELKATLEQAGIQARELDLQLGFEQHGAQQDPAEARAGKHAGGGHEQAAQSREHERRLLRTLSARAGGIDTYA